MELNYSIINNNDLKIYELRKVIEDNLMPLISDDYAIYDLQYHFNVGDHLIYEGMLSFLKMTNKKCIDKASRFSFKSPKLNKEIVIIFHGGGNLGDLYPEHMTFLKLLVDTYPQNKIIVFPQTIYYQNNENLTADFKILNKHSNLTICARDELTFNILESNFSGKNLLLPDMAFFFDYKTYNNNHKLGSKSKNLYLKRNDIELNNNNGYKANKDFDIKDWPKLIYYPDIFIYRIAQRIFIKKISFIDKYLIDFYESYFDNFMRKRIITASIIFFNNYKVIVSSRLHGGILAILLDIDCVLLNNSYGKNKAVFDTWLKGFKNIDFN
jgi:exopolysaccharide biosynthesis predicted pyruvyltransferase EpsI